MSPRKSRLETAFLWVWALTFCLSMLAGVAQFGVDTFDVPLSRESKRMLWNFIGAPLALTIFALPVYAAATASGFFENQNVR